MKHSVITTWKKEMEFETSIDEHNISIDAMKEHGGQNQGVSPKKLMLSALAGCTGMDVVSILKKMKVSFQEFQIHIEANITEEHPKHYDKLHIVYEFALQDADKDKLQKAIELSQEKYCGVSYMFKQFAQITYEIKIQKKKSLKNELYNNNFSNLAACRSLYCLSISKD
jgi:putative redox protein